MRKLTATIFLHWHSINKHFRSYILHRLLVKRHTCGALPTCCDRWRCSSGLILGAARLDGLCRAGLSGFPAPSAAAAAAAAAPEWAASCALASATAGLAASCGGSNWLCTSCGSARSSLLACIVDRSARPFCTASASGTPIAAAWAASSPEQLCLNCTFASKQHYSTCEILHVVNWIV